MTCCGEEESTFTFIWRIENFSLSELRDESFLVSQAFTPHLYDGVKLSLHFYPRPGEKCSCWVVRDSTDVGVDVTLRYYFEIICTDGDVLKSDKKVCTFGKGASDYWSYFIDHQTILENRSKFLPADCLTIRLHMWGEAEVLNIYRIIARTEIVAEKYSLLWNLQNFSSCVSTKIEFSFAGGLICELTLDASDDDLKITICQMNWVGPRILRSEIFVQDSAGVSKWSKLQEHQFSRTNRTWEFPSFLKKSKLTTEKRTFLKHDVLRLYCKFALSTGETRNEINCHFKEFRATNSNIPFLSLQEDFQNMFISKKMADVIFKVGGKTLQAHKVILAARSPVFSAMFEQEMLENKSGIVDIPDMSYDTLEELLMFMYGAKLENLNFERAMNLMVAADKYQVLSLKNECLIFLKLNLSDENVSQVLALSDTIQDEILKISAIEYFKRHKKTILTSTEWKELRENNIRLATDVLTISALED